MTNKILKVAAILMIIHGALMLLMPFAANSFNTEEIPPIFAFGN